MYTPELESFRRLAAQGNLIPVYREILADMETPVSTLQKLLGRPHVFLLESVEGGEKWGRYTFLGSDPRLVVRVRGDVVEIEEAGQVKRVAHGGDPLGVLRQLMARYHPVTVAGLPRFYGGAGGYLGFDMVRYFERLPAAACDDLSTDEAVFLITDTLAIFDNVRHSLKLVSCAFLEEGCDPDDMYAKALEKIEALATLLAAPPAPGPTASAAGTDRDAQVRSGTSSFVDAGRNRGTVAAIGAGEVDSLPEGGTWGVTAAEARRAPTASTPVATILRTGDSRLSDANWLDLSFHSNMTPAVFMQMVRRAKEYIVQGDIIQVVLAQRFELNAAIPPFALYRALRFINPSPYLFFFQSNDMALVGSSPEVMVRLEDGIAELKPIAGTRRRGRDEQEDRALADELLQDQKERAEHVMLVDLGRNDLGRIARIGSVQVDQLMAVERYSHVMHLVSHIQAQLEDGRDCFDVLRATFPAGTLSGAPKLRAIEIIAELEPCRRGPYGGAVGYFSYTGNMDFCITIRTIIAHRDRLFIQAGAGIVADSDPQAEYEETLNKGEAMRRAVALAAAGFTLTAPTSGPYITTGEPAERRQSGVACSQQDHYVK